jgi:hypothetical protein
MPRHWFAVALATLSLLVGAITPRIGDAGARHDAEESVVEFRPVAEQELSLVGDPLVWQASELPTFLDEEHPIPFFAGFLYANTTPLVVYRDSGEHLVRLGQDDAMPVEDGELLAPVALRGDDATFLALELVAEDEAFDPTGDPFEPKAGGYVLELLRAEFERVEGARDRPVTLDVVELSEQPVLLVVVAGELELSLTDDDPEELKSGDVLTVTEEVEVRRRGEEPGVVLAAALRLPVEGDEIDPEDEARPTAAPDGAAGQGSASGDGEDSGTGADESAPTPRPTEAPGANTGGTSGGSELPDTPPTDEPGNSGGSDAGSGGSDAGSGGVGVEEGPGDGECLYCAPADDGLLAEGDTADPCLLADGGGDTDSDGLNNCAEAAAGTSSTVQDSDGDSAWDGDEVRLGTNPTHPDTDGDGLDDGDELLVFFTDPFVGDTDGDGLIDLDEVHTFGTNPNAADTDGDGLWDLDELNRVTNPTVRDTDGDCLNDGYEVSLGSSPHVMDTDSDGYSDNFENGVSDPRDPNDEPDLFQDLGECVK